MAQQRQLHQHHHMNSRSKTPLSLFKLGGKISPSNLQINLIEPVLYFRGDTEESVGCFLRGNLTLNLSKPTKIRKIGMKFVGKMKTFWKDGSLYYGSANQQNELCEEQEITKHNWTFVTSPTLSSETSPPSSPLNSNPNPYRFKILRPRSFSLSSNTSATPKYHLIPAGVHEYPFELFIPGSFPETIETDSGKVTYKLSAVVVRPGLSPNLHVSRNVTIVRTVFEERNSEGIAISSEWNNQLGYEITMPKKAYPIGDSIDIDLKLSLRKKNTKIVGIKIQINEDSTYKANGLKKSDSRTLSVHKIDDFAEQRKFSGKNGRDKVQEGNSSSPHILKHEDEDEVLENSSYHKNISFLIPDCTSSIHNSYNSSSIIISHHLKFIFTIKQSASDNNDDNKKKKKFDVKVDVPITILSCRCADDLPQYEDDNHNYYQHNDNSLSFESPPSYEQSRHNSSANIIGIITSDTSQATDLRHPPLERLLTV